MHSLFALFQQSGDACQGLNTDGFQLPEWHSTDGRMLIPGQPDWFQVRWSNCGQ